MGKPDDAVKEGRKIRRRAVTRQQAAPAWRGKARAAGLIVLMLALSAAVSVATVRLTVPPVVTFDMKGTLDTFMQQSAKQQLTEDGARALTLRFNAALSESLSAWQAEHGGTVLVAPAVVSPAYDITADVRADVARRMQARP